MAKIVFDIANTARDAWGARICSREELEQMQDSEVVRVNCAKATEVFKDWTVATPKEETVRLKQEAARYKIKLPVVLPHAHFKDGHRCNDSAVESGLMSMDFDHIDDPRGYWETVVKPHMKELHVLWAFISPTSTGVKVISVKPSNLTLKEAQAWFAGVISEENWDSTFDKSRCVYLVPKKYNLYYDADKLFGEHEVFEVEKFGESLTKRPGPVVSESLENRCSVGKLMSIPFDGTAMYSGVPFTKIIDAFWQKMYGKQPQEGMRHQALLDWVREGSTICEFKAERLMQVTPRLGKDDEELARIVVDTLVWKKKNFRPTMPHTLVCVLREMGLNKDDSAGSLSIEAFNEMYLKRMPKLPPALGAAVNGVDRKYHLAVIFGLLPAFSSFAERLLYKHCDHSIRRPALFSFCVGASGSGKDNLTKRYSALMAMQDSNDVVSRDKNDEVRNNNLNKTANEQGKTETVFVKQRALDISDADLLHWMKVSRKEGYMVEGRLLPRKVMMFSSEAGIVRNAVKDGKLMVCWRLGFDCDKKEADRRTSASTSGSEQICIDISAECTPGVLKTLISSESQEDGTAGRLLISFVPADPFSDMPIKEEVSEKDKALMHEGLELCRDFEGVIDSPRLRKSLTDWNNEVGRAARETGDLKHGMLRRRACIMGMCAAIICAILWNKWKDGKLVITKQSIDFGLLTAEYAMETACAVFEDYAENTDVKYNLGVSQNNRVGKNHDLIDKLGEVFTRDDVKALKPEVGKSGISNIINRMKESKQIVEYEPLKYRKSPPTPEG